MEQIVSTTFIYCFGWWNELPFPRLLKSFQHKYRKKKLLSHPYVVLFKKKKIVQTENHNKSVNPTSAKLKKKLKKKMHIFDILDQPSKMEELHAAMTKLVKLQI